MGWNGANTYGVRVDSARVADNGGVTSVNGLTGAVTIAASGSPAGSVLYFAASSAPSGYLKANGAAVSRSTYADLFAAIGTTFGSGDGSSTFNLPDLRGQFPRGWDDGRGLDSGRIFGSSQSYAIRNISGAIQIQAGGGPASGFPAQNVAGNPFYSSGGTSRGTSSGSSLSLATTLNIDVSRQVQTATETRPTNVALLACIKY